VILVDTSVWVEAFRRGHGPAAEGLRALLDADEVAITAPVRIELLSGSSASDLPRLRRTLSALPRFDPGPRIWERIEGWVERAVPVGRRFGVTDLLIAAVAAENELSVWSLDGDFAEMAKLGLIQLRET
jgi:predicted nucleic acid-binding protein